MASRYCSEQCREYISLTTEVQLDGAALQHLEAVPPNASTASSPHKQKWVSFKRENFKTKQKNLPLYPNLAF